MESVSLAAVRSNRSTQSPKSNSHNEFGMFAALSTRNFRIFVTGQLVSNIGGWAQRLAQDWLVLSLTGSAAAVGVTTALQFLPTLLFGPVGGAIADRFPKRSVLMVTQSVMGAAAAAMAVLIVTGTVHPLEIDALALVLGFATAVDNPTRQAFANELVGATHLGNAISLNSAAFQMGALAGPAVGGLLIGVAGMGAAFTLNALSFGFSVCMLLRIRSGDLHRSELRHSARIKVPVVVRTMRRNPRMWYPMVLAAIASLFTTNFPVTLAAFSANVFHTGVAGFAVLSGSLAVGSLAGSLLAARQGPLRLRGVVAVAGCLGLAQLVAAVAPGRPALAAALVAVGATAVLFGVTANSTVQLTAGDASRGTVMGVYLLAVVGAGCLGGPLLGGLDQLVGPRAALAAGGLVVVLAAAAVAARLAALSELRMRDVIPARMAALARR